MGYCHKHGVFSTFCRGCDLDIIEEDEMRGERTKPYDYRFQQRVRYQIRQQSDFSLMFEHPMEYVFQWGANSDNSLMEEPVHRFKNELERISKQYIKNNLPKLVPGLTSHVWIEILRCDTVGIPGFLTDHDVHPVIADLLK